MKPLEGKVALVAGASRGAGRGIARMLGEAGATVWCTARTGADRSGPTGRPETVEETAALVNAEGGRGIAARVDHADEPAVARLFERIGDETGPLYLAVNALAGPRVENWGPFWTWTPAEGRAMVDGWIWPHVHTAWHAATLMKERGTGIFVEITELHTIQMSGPLFYDLARLALKRFVHAMAEELAPHGVTALAVAPGFMRTETVLDALDATEENWREVAETNPEARRYRLDLSETPCFVGRGVAALAADPAIGERSGGIFGSWDLADDYGFEDVDGNDPRWGRDVGVTSFGEPATRYRWELVRAG